MRILVLLFIPFAHAEPVDQALQNVRENIVAECRPRTLLRTCYSVDQTTCEKRVVSLAESCLRDQRIRLMGQTSVDVSGRRQIASEVSACVGREYYALGASSFNSKAPVCAKYKANAPKPVAITSSRERTAAFTDPLEGQTGINYNEAYKRELIKGMAEARQLKARVANGSICPAGSGELLSDCFRREMARFEIRTSTQMVELMVVATLAGLQDRKKLGNGPARTKMLDNIIFIAEHVNLQKFFVGKAKANGHTESGNLAYLRDMETKLLRAGIQRIANIIIAADSKGRAPAMSSDDRARLDALLARDWRF